MSSREGGFWCVINSCDADALGGHGVATFAIGDDEVDAVVVVEVRVVEVVIGCVGVGLGIDVVGDIPPRGGDAGNGERVVISVGEAF